MPDFPNSIRAIDIARALSAYSPRILPDGAARQRAAVAIALRDGSDGAEALLIRRAEHPLDPWSGHMAFPGGRFEPGDASLEATARRETLEEVGLALSPEDRIGRLDEQASASGGQGGILMAPFVYRIAQTPALALSPEVAEAVWIPLARFARPGQLAPYRPDGGAAGPAYSSLRIGAYTIWGMTYRTIANLMSLLGARLPGELHEPAE